jgi:hypothetical protein
MSYSSNTTPTYPWIYSTFRFDTFHQSQEYASSLPFYCATRLESELDSSQPNTTGSLVTRNSVTVTNWFGVCCALFVLGGLLATL